MMFLSGIITVVINGFQVLLNRRLVLYLIVWKSPLEVIDVVTKVKFESVLLTVIHYTKTNCELDLPVLEETPTSTEPSAPKKGTPTESNANGAPAPPDETVVSPTPTVKVPKRVRVPVKRYEPNWS